MHIVLVSGSHRDKSQSSKVAAFAANALKKLDDTLTTDIIDLAGNPLPLWDGYPKPETEAGKRWAPFSERLKKADALVIVSPEWHGTVPAGLKNFMLHWSAPEVGHKPALIITVSSSGNGTYPVNELRTSGYKNSRILYLPEHVIVRDVNNVLNDTAETTEADGYIRRRLDFALRILTSYADALGPVRASGVTASKDFANGM